VCVGYGFGDVHVNQVLADWLSFSSERKLEIVAPGISAIPSFLLHLAPQVKLASRTASDYFDDCAGIVRTRVERVEKRFAAFARGRPKKAVEQALHDFTQAYQRRSVEKLAAALQTMPIRDGDLDLDALGRSQEELVGDMVGPLRLTADDLLEDFLDAFETTVPPSKPSTQEIAEAAYLRWLGRGTAHGADLEDWLVAEARLSALRTS